MSGMDLSALNDSQRRAVMCEDPAVLVLAGPGSGKTRVLTTRVMKLLSESAGDSFRILGLTFTHKAAEEMRQRVKAETGAEASRATLTTFHAFAADVLRQHGRHVGLKPDFRIINDDAERKLVLRELLDEMADSAPATPTKLDTLASIDTIMKQGLLPSEAASAFPKSSVAGFLQEVYTAYLEKLVTQNAIDFGGLLVQLRMLLETRPAIAKQLRLVYPYVCVDEFQDTNVAQYRVLQLITPPGEGSLFVVADDDQIIYAWNGASTDRLRTLRRDYGVTVIQLPENYRCPNDVVRMADALISHNSDRSADKRAFEAVKAAGTPSVRIHRFKSADDEAAWIAADLEGRADRSECIVLARAKGLLDRVVSALDARGITGVITARKNAFGSAAVVWLDALLRLLCRPDARDHLARLDNAFYRLEGLHVQMPAATMGDPLTAWFAAARSAGPLEPGTIELLEEIHDLVANRDVPALVSRCRTWFLDIRTVSEGTTPEAWEHFDEEIEILDGHVRDICDRFEANDLSIATFLQEFDLMPKIAAVPTDAVRCSTIHLAKGLEYPHVYLIGAVEGILPDFRAAQKGDTHPDLEEERRNCFVAITRCEDSLTLTFADSYNGYAKIPSRFIAEMGLRVPAAYDQVAF